MPCAVGVPACRRRSRRRPTRGSRGRRCTRWRRPGGRGACGHGTGGRGQRLLRVTPVIDGIQVGAPEQPDLVEICVPLSLRPQTCSNDGVTDPLDRADLGDAAGGGASRVARRRGRVDRAAVERWQHRRTLLDVIRECMHRGDTIALRLGDITFTGLVQAIGDDLVALAARDGRVDVRVDGHTPLVVRVARTCAYRRHARRRGHHVPRPPARARDGRARRRDRRRCRRRRRVRATHRRP